jgi:hypothetical protein
MHNLAQRYLLLGICLLGTGFTTVVSPQQRALTLTQIQKLVQIRTPDNIVADAVKSRGLAFTPTAKIVSDLQAHGAGEATLAAIRAQIPIGTLEVQSEPGTLITLDGVDRGATNEAGKLLLPDLLAGPHHLSARKDGYQSSELDLTLAAKEYKRVPVPLEWAGGYVTVRVDPPGATIAIDRLGQYQNGVSDLQCPVGMYAVTVTRTGMKTESRSVNVAVGQHALLEIHLVIDPQYAASRIAEAKSRLARGDALSAIQISREMLPSQATNPEVLSVLAAGYWQVRNARDFQSSATDALRNGGSVTVGLMHEHHGISGESIHPAVLTVSATTITYDPGGGSCQVKAFTVPLDNIQLSEVTAKTTVGPIVVRHLAPGTFLLHLDIRDPESGRKPIALYLASPGSRVEKPSGRVGVLESPSGSSELLNALANTLHTTTAGHQ